MTASALTWFYNNPGTNAGEIGERVNNTLWEARIGGIWLEVTSAQSPYQMQGFNHGTPVSIEWVPGQYLLLRLQSDQPRLVQQLNFVLAFSAIFTYTDPQGNTCYEWHHSDPETRWRALSGNPQYQNLRKLS